MASNNHTYFVDANVLLDVLLQREGFYEPALQVLKAAELGKVRLQTSVLVYAVIIHFCKTGLTKDELKTKIKHLKALVGVLPCNHEAVDVAVASDFPDIEDAMQNQIAESNGIKTIITRDKKGFKHSNLSILTPEEFLSTQKL
jgi:predicted nucleic acid-binding protein